VIGFMTPSVGVPRVPLILHRQPALLGGFGAVLWRNVVHRATSRPRVA
jgi:hypothetical protein